MSLLEIYERYETDYITRKRDEQQKYLNENLNHCINNGENSDAIFLLGFINLIQGNLDHALNAFKTMDRSNPFYHLGLGLVSVKKAQREYNVEICSEAIEHIKEAIHLHLNNTRNQFLIAEYHLGQAYSLRGIIKIPRGISEYKSAVDDFKYAQSKFHSLIDRSFNLPFCYNELGNISLKLDQEAKMDIALKYYDDALKLKKFSRPFNGRGNVYRHQKLWRHAIEEYQKAIDYEPDFYYPYNYLGDCYRILEKHNKAIKYYRKAISINPNISYAWYGLGRVYYELGNRKMDPQYYDLAEENVKLALNINKRFGHAIHDYAKILEKKGALLSAKEKYEEYLTLITSLDGIDYIQNQIQALEKTLRFEDDLKTKKEQDIVTEILARTRDLEDKTNLAKETFTYSFFNEPIRDSVPEAYLEVLRKWNSYTPIVRDGSKGGGYFIKAFNKGIVIDPGFNFIENFIAAGHKFSEIDIILISHAHDDHTADLESIISLLFRYNDHLIEKIIPRQIAKEQNTSTIFEAHNRRIVCKRWQTSRKHIDIFLSPGTYKKYSGLFNSDKSNCADLIDHHLPVDPVICKNSYRIEAVEPHKTILDNSEFTIKSIRANHKDLNDLGPCLGFVIDFPTLGTSIIYTGDTGWSGMEKQYCDLKEELSDRKLLLIAHIGGFKPREREYFDPSKGSEDYSYKQHLGRIGLAKINEILKPDLCLISEYGEEFEYSRLKIAEIFGEVFHTYFERNLISKDIKFFPADIGLNIAIANQFSIKAVSSIDPATHTYQQSYCNIEDVRAGEASLKNQLFYFDNALIERDCIKAMDNFEELIALDSVKGR